MNIALALALAADVRTNLAAHVQNGHAGLSPQLERAVDDTVTRLLQTAYPDAEVSLATARTLVRQATAEVTGLPAFGVLTPRSY